MSKKALLVFSLLCMQLNAAEQNSNKQPQLERAYFQTAIDGLCAGFGTITAATSGALFLRSDLFKRSLFFENPEQYEESLVAAFALGTFLGLQATISQACRDGYSSPEAFGNWQKSKIAALTITLGLEEVRKNRDQIKAEFDREKRNHIFLNDKEKKAMQRVFDKAKIVGLSIPSIIGAVYYTSTLLVGEIPGE